MSFFYAWTMLACTGLLATMVPGAAFAIVLRNSTSISRKAGVLTAAGLALGLALHAILVLLGIGSIFLKNRLICECIRWAGASYLIYLGIGCLRYKVKKNVLAFAQSNEEGSRTDFLSISDQRKALKDGFITNATNPKVILFLTALFVRFLSPDLPFQVGCLYLISLVCIEFAWFSFVAFILTHPVLQRMYGEKVHWLERASGIILLGLGVSLMLTSMFTSYG